jgi:hypothetical protein
MQSRFEIAAQAGTRKGNEENDGVGRPQNEKHHDPVPTYPRLTAKNNKSQLNAAVGPLNGKLEN